MLIKIAKNSTHEIRQQHFNMHKLLQQTSWKSYTPIKVNNQQLLITKVVPNAYSHKQKQKHLNTKP